MVFQMPVTSVRSGTMASMEMQTEHRTLAIAMGWGPHAIPTGIAFPQTTVLNVSVWRVTKVTVSLPAKTPMNAQPTHHPA